MSRRALKRNPILCGLFLAISVVVAPSAVAQEQDRIDPFCSTLSRANIVSAARAELAQRMQLGRNRPLAKQDSTPATLGLQWDARARLPHLFFRAPVGQVLQIDSTPSLPTAGWQSLLTLNMLSPEVEWLDSTAGAAVGQFYRLTRLTDTSLLEFVDNFLLLDQQSKAHELFYPTNLRAVVIVAGGDSMSRLGRSLTALRTLTQAYSPNVLQFWVLLNDPSAARTNVAAQVQLLGVDVPVLLDPEGLGTRALQLTHAGEAVVVLPPAFSVAYRGDLESGTNATGEQTYLEAALASLVQGQAFAFLRTPLTGPRLSASDAGTPSYSREVAPIFRQYCAICHRPGDVAPFALTSYDVASGWAPAIKQALLSNAMPPWHADPEFGNWSNSLALPVAARSALLRWIDAGAPRGEGPDPLAGLPPPPSYRAWPTELGPPDALVTPGVQQIKTFGTEPYRYLFVQSPNPTNVWLRAAIILPSNPSIVHHYLVWTGRVGNQGVDGFSTYQSSLAGYSPGGAPYVYPSDSGYLLDASSWLTFNLHYTPNGQATNDTPVLALWYHKTQPPKTIHDVSVANPLFRIAPGDPESPVQAQWLFANAVRVVRLNPHMHLRGKYAHFEAVYPDGTRETLLSVPDYNFKWQTGYEFAEPKSLPAGTRLVVSGAFDNSPENIYNPDPAARVTWGDQTWAEMFVGFVDYVD